MKKGCYLFVGKPKCISDFIKKEYDENELISIIIDNEDIEEKLADGRIA